jgi:hypothetical protein
MEEELSTSPFLATENYNESGFSGNWTNETGSGNWTIGEGKSGVISLNFLDSFVKALSVMIVSELGDKTFFLAGMKYFYNFVNLIFLHTFLYFLNLAYV